MSGMLAHRLNSSGRQLVEALRVPLRLRVVGGAETPSDTFRAWAWEGYHRSFMGPWAAVVVSYICLLMRDMQGLYQKITISLMGLTALSLAATSFNLIPFIKREDQHKWARYLIIQFSALQITLTWILVFEGHYVGDSLVRVCKYWLDVFTNLGVTVPNLAMADWSTGAWLVYVCAHISSSAPLFVNWMGYSIPFAVFKVVFIQSLGLFVYITMERSKFALFFVELRQKQQRIEKKLAHLEGGPNTAGPSGSSARQLNPSSDSQGESAPAEQEQALARPVQKSCQAEDLVTLPYKSLLKRHKVVIKINAEIDPEDFQASPRCQQLCTQISYSFNNCVMVETAARRGCLMLSLHLCELLRLAPQQPEVMQRPATELKLAEEVASLIMSWLNAQAQLMNGLQGRLADGTVVSVQVNNCTFRGTWSSSMQALKLAPDAGPSSPILESLYSITLAEPALLLPPPAASVAPAAAACTYEIQPQQEQLPLSKHASSITVAASFRVPVGSPQLVGWQEQDEGRHAAMVDADKLVVLASARGWCLPVEIAHQPELKTPRVGQPGGADEEERAVQVCISLPQDLLHSNHCLRLELVSNSILLCTRNILVLSCECAEVYQEIKDWALSPCDPAQVTAFVDDLAEFLSFQSLVCSKDATSATMIAAGAGAEGDAVVGGIDAEGKERNGLLGALVAEARRPEMDLMMAEVGLELLQHAISCGMASLAEHLLGALLAYPLSLPFDAIACGKLPHIHHTHSLDSSAAVQELEKEPNKQLQEIDTHASFLEGRPATHAQSGQGPDNLCCQSLLTLALLSYNRRSLACVLEWGRLYGRAHGHAWAWDFDAVDACGYSASQIMQRMPPEHPLMELLLSHETSASAATHAQQIALQMRESPTNSSTSNGKLSGEQVSCPEEGRTSCSKVIAAATAAVAGSAAAGRAAASTAVPAMAAATAIAAASAAAAAVAVAAPRVATAATATVAATTAAAAAATAATSPAITAAAPPASTTSAAVPVVAAAAAGAAATTAAVAAKTAAAALTVAATPPLVTASHAPLRLLHDALKAVSGLCRRFMEAMLRMCGKYFSFCIRLKIVKCSRQNAQNDC